MNRFLKIKGRFLATITRHVVCLLVFQLIFAATIVRVSLANQQLAAEQNKEPIELIEKDSSIYNLNGELKITDNSEDFYYLNSAEEKELFNQYKILMAARNVAVRGSLLALEQLVKLHAALNDRYGKDWSMARYYKQAVRAVNFQKDLPKKLAKSVPQVHWRHYKSIQLLVTRILASREETPKIEIEQFYQKIVDSAFTLFLNDLEEFYLVKERKLIAKKLKNRVDRKEQERIQYINFRLGQIKKIKEHADRYNSYLKIPIRDWGIIEPKMFFFETAKIDYYLYHYIIASYLVQFPKFKKLFDVSKPLLKVKRNFSEETRVMAKAIFKASSEYAKVAYLGKERDKNLAAIEILIKFLKRRLPAKYLAVLTITEDNGGEQQEATALYPDVSFLAIKKMTATVSLQLEEALRSAINTHLDHLKYLSNVKYQLNLIRKRKDRKLFYQLAGRGIENVVQYQSSIGSRLRNVNDKLLHLMISAEMAEVVWQEVISPTAAMSKLYFKTVVEKLQQKIIAKKESAEKSFLLWIGGVLGFCCLVLPFLPIPGARVIGALLFSISMPIILAARWNSYREMKPYYHFSEMAVNDFKQFFPEDLAIVEIPLKDRMKWIDLENKQYGALYSAAIWCALDSLFIFTRLFKIVRVVGRSKFFLNENKFHRVCRLIWRDYRPLRMLELFKQKWRSASSLKKFVMHGRFAVALLLFVTYISLRLNDMSAPSFNKMATMALISKREKVNKFFAEHPSLKDLSAEKLKQLQHVLELRDHKYLNGEFERFYGEEIDLDDPLQSSMVLYDEAFMRFFAGKIYLNYKFVANNQLPEISKEVCFNYYLEYLAPVYFLSRAIEEEKLDIIDAYFDFLQPDRIKQLFRINEVLQSEEDYQQLMQTTIMQDTILEAKDYALDCSLIAEDYLSH